jgi:hypothetical protein
MVRRNYRFLTFVKEDYRISWPIKRIVIFSLEILEKRKSNGECILILVIYWKKTGLFTYQN